MPGVTEQAGAQRTEDGTGSEPTDATSPDAGGGNEAASTGSSGSAEQASDSSSDTSSGADASTTSSQESGASQAATTATATQAPERSSDDPPPSDAPTTQHRTPDTAHSAHTAHTSETSAPRGREEHAPLNVGELVWKVAKVVASVVRVVAYVIAIVLVAYVLLTLVGVNPLNAVAQVVGGVANATVLAFRDLFLVADPTFAVVVNYGLAAVFWVLVAEFGSRIVRWLGARFS